MSSACKGQRQHRPKILQFWNVNMFPEESSLTRKGSCDDLSSPCHCYKYWCMYCDVMWWWWLWWWRLESSMLLLPSLRGGEWNTEPEWHLERSARTMLDFSVKIQQRWLNMAVQNGWQYYEDMTKDFMRGIHVQMSLRKPQTYLMATETTSLAGFWFRVSNNQNGNLRWFLPLGVDPSPPP